MVYITESQNEKLVAIVLLPIVVSPSTSAKVISKGFKEPILLLLLLLFCPPSLFVIQILNTKVFKINCVHRENDKIVMQA